MAIVIKPHHYMDIIKLYGSGLNQFVPDLNYQHAFYAVGNEILNHPDVEITLTLDCDDICVPCRFKGEDGLCTDEVTAFAGYTSKDAYNKMLDQRLIDLLKLDPAEKRRSRDFCALLYAQKEVIFQVWTLEDPKVTQRRYELFCLGCQRYLKK